MERLTYKGPELPFTDDDGDVVEAYSDRGVREIINRLAVYEDTGLEPEEIKDMADNAETRLLTWFESRYGYPAGELMRILEAKQEGRLVVLPCGTDAESDVIDDPEWKERMMQKFVGRR